MLSAVKHLERRQSPQGTKSLWQQDTNKFTQETLHWQEKVNLNSTFQRTSTSVMNSFTMLFKVVIFIQMCCVRFLLPLQSYLGQLKG